MLGPGVLRGASGVPRQAGPLPREHSLHPMDLGRGLFLSGFSGDLRATSVPPQMVALMDLAGFNALHTGGRGARTCLKSPSRTGAHSGDGVGGKDEPRWAWEPGFGQGLSGTCLPMAAERPVGGSGVEGPLGALSRPCF